MFFTDWMNIVRTIVVGTLAYSALVILLRISGKRTLSKMNAFDRIITISLGSTLASALVSPTVVLVQAIVAFVLLIGMQFGVTWLSVRSAWVRRLVKSEPSLLFYQGHFLHNVMKIERVTEGEIRTAVRQQAFAELAHVGAIVLETDGTLTVIGSALPPVASALANVANYSSQGTGEEA